MDKDFEDYIVTSDDMLLEELWAKFDEGISSQQLGTYAHSLGLYPPDYEEGQKDSITVSGFPESDRRYLVWSIGLDRPDPTYLDQAREEAEEGDEDFFYGDMWAGVVPTGRIYDTNSDKQQHE